MIISRTCALLALCLLCLISPSTQAETAEHCITDPCVELQTSAGNIVIQLNNERAPVSVQNFLAYVDKGHYDGLIFHRIIPGFMIQGGGFDADFEERKSAKPIINESRNGLSNLRGTIAMARTPNPNSATSQFFINLVDNRRLDASEYRWGYAVFGKVVAGMDVVDAIAGVPTGAAGPFAQNAPQAAILIEKAVRKNDVPGPSLK